MVPQVRQQLQTRMRAMERDPRFASLSYEEQLNARSTLAGGVLQQDPEYQQLSETDRRSAINTIATAYRPVFEDQKVAKTVEPIFKRAEAGKMSRAEVWGIEALTGLNGSSLAAGLLMKPAAKLANAITEPFTDEEAFNPALMMDAHTGTDGDKLSSYVQQKLWERNKQDALRSAQGGNVVGNLIGMVGDLGVFYGSWQSVAAKPIGAAGAAIGKQLPGRLGTWAGKVAMPSAIEGATSGVYGVFREQFLNTVNDPDEQRQRTFQNVAKTFGEWALLDFAANAAFGTMIPHLGGAFRRAFGKAKRAKTTRVHTPKEVDDLITQLQQGEVAPELIGQLDEATYRFYRGAADTRTAAARAGKDVRLRPYEDLLLRSHDAGMTTFRDPSSGNYFIHSYDPKSGNAVEEQFDNIIAARRRVSKGLRRRAKELSGDARQDFLRRNKNMLTYSITEEMIDGAMDPLKVKGQLGPKEEALLKPLKQGRAKGFVSPVDRPYVGANEADTLKKAFSETGYAQTLKVNVPEEQLTRIAKGDLPFQEGMPMRVQAAEDGTEAFVFLRRPAPAEAVQEAAKNAKKAVARGAPDNAEVLRNMYLMEAGYDGIVEGSGRVQMFYPDRIKLLATKFDPTTGRIGELTTVKTEEPSVESFVSRQYDATVGGKTLARNKKLVTRAASSFKGDLNGDDVQKFSRMILSERGVDPSKVHVKVGQYADRTSVADDVLANASINKRTGNVTIEVPKRISTPAKQKQFLKELFEEEFDNVIKTLGDPSKAKSMVYPKLGKSTTALFKSPFPSQQATEKWLRSGVEDIAGGVFNKTARGYEVRLPGRTPITTDSLEELTDRVMMETMDLGYLKMDMAKRGYKLTKKGKTIVVRGPGLDEPVTGRSVNEVADKLNYRPEKISDRFAPKIGFIDDSIAEVRFDNDVVVGSRRSLKKLMSKFEDMDEVAKMQRISQHSDGEVFLRPAGDYEVRMPKQGIVQHFETKAAAERFVRRNWKNFDELQSIAKRKGLQMWQSGRTFKVGDGSSTFTVKSKDDLIRVFNEYPDATGGREAVAGAVTPDELNMVDQVLDRFQKAKVPPQQTSPVKPLGDINVLKEGTVPEMGASGEFRALLDNMDHWAEKTLKKMGLPEVLRKYRNIETAFRATKAKVDEAEDVVLSIFTDSKTGKLLPEARRKAIYYHSGAQTAQEQLEAIEMFGELSSTEKRMAGQLRSLLGEEKGGVITGLAGEFGVPAKDFLDHYMPRIMDWAVQNQKAVAKMTTAEELVEAAMKERYGTKAPKQLKAFFKNMRTSEALEFAAIDDPIKALQHYVRVGYRQKYMGRAWEELYTELSNSNVGPGVLMRFNRYRETLMGMSASQGEKMVRRIGESMGKTLGVKNGGSMMDAYFSLNYLANMGYRPWLAIRNSYQVWTTLASRMGNSWVDDAVGEVNRFTDADYKYLQNIGVIPNQPPIVNTIMDADSVLGRVTHKALGMFKSTDEYTRAVGYTTAKRRFNYAMDKWRKGGIKDIDGFLKEAGVSKMDDDTISEVRRLVEAGTDDSIDAAKARFGTQLSEESFFGYRRSQAPMIHTGSFWGKLFGQYGTYAAGYRAVISRGLSYGNVGDKAAFLARFLGNQAALYGAFQALKVDADSFIPGSPALFGGGPNFEVAINIFQSLGPTYKSKQARSVLARKFSPVRHSEEKGLYLNYPEMLPGSIQLRYAQKALEYAEQGDNWRAFLAITTTPVVDPEGP